MNWNRQIHYTNISAWPHCQSKRGGSCSRSKDLWFWNYKYNKHIWAWGLQVLTLLAMDCLLKTSSLNVTNNPLSCTLRPVIPQQTRNHSLSFKPHKARVEVKARRLESDLCFFCWNQNVAFWGNHQESSCDPTVLSGSIEELWKDTLWRRCQVTVI